MPSFVCESNILETAERICVKFIGKTCLVPRSDEFECQGQRSKIKVTGDKKELHTPIGPGSDGMVQSAAHSALQCIVNGTACVRFMFGKTSLP